MITLTKISVVEFKERQSSFDLIIGDKKCNEPNYYVLSFFDESHNLSIGLINNYPNMDLDPQVEIVNQNLIIGNNEILVILNVETRKTKEFFVDPFFYKFVISDQRIIVMSEASAFCLLEDNVVWNINSFGDMISFERLDHDNLIVSTYEYQREICIDILSGKYK